MGRPPACNCNCESPTPTPEDCPPFVCPSAKHRNTEGSTSDYTLSTKTWGTGLTINSSSLVTDAAHGHPKPCLRLSVNWSQAKQPPFYFPSIIPPGGLGYEPLFGAWVICELNGGPQVSLDAGEWLQNISLNVNTKRVNVRPLPSTMTGRYLLQGAPGFVDTSGPGPVFTGGTFTITIGTETTASLSYNANAATVQTAIEALPSIGSGGVTVTGGILGQNFFVLRFSDGLTHAVTGNAAALLPNGGNITSKWLNHFDYSIIPVVIQNGIIYGPTPALYSFEGPTIGTHDGEESNWQCRSVASCLGKSIIGGASSVTGAFNLTAHSRYNEFLENVLAYPSGIVVPCQQYCRSQDSFGDWENATVQRANPTITTASEFPLWDTWVPPTPDFSVGNYTLGFAVMFFADEPGNYSADLLLDNLCLDWTVRPRIVPCGNLLVDEPMDAAVPAWTQANMLADPPSGNCDFGEEVYCGAVWRIDSGFLITDHIVASQFCTSDPIGNYVGGLTYGWRDRIYAGGSLFQTLDRNGPGSIWRNSNFCLTVECELQRIHEEDAEWYAEDEPNTPSNPTSINLNLRRPTEDFGIFVGGIAKFGVMRNAQVYGQSSDNHICTRSFYYLHYDGNIGTNGELATACMSAEAKSYECANVGEGSHRVPFQGGGAFKTGTEFHPQASAVPLKNDVLRLEVKWAAMQSNAFDCAANGRYLVRAWLNDQESFHMVFVPSGAGDPSIVDVSAGFPGAPFWIHPPSVGVYAHQGGKFRNFKAWLRPS